MAASKKELIAFRKLGSIARVERPLKVKRARTLGYKAKQGFSVVRVRVIKGKRMQPKRSGGRRPKRFGHYFTTGKSKRQIAEEKASRKYPNLEVLGSYLAGDDGVHSWFECIMIDPHHPAVSAGPAAAAAARRGRAFRGLTSAGKKSRGLRK